MTEVGGKLDMELETALRARVAEPGEVVVLASQSLRDLIAMQTSLGDTVLRPKNLAHI